MEATKVYFGQITAALFEVGGQYREICKQRTTFCEAKCVNLDFIGSLEIERFVLRRKVCESLSPIFYQDLKQLIVKTFHERSFFYKIEGNIYQKQYIYFFYHKL
jgi:hypothetical protein